MARVAALVPLIFALALSATVSAAPAGTFSFAASADTYVDQGFPKKNYGIGKRVWSQGTPNPVNEAYFRFNLTGISGTVTGAKLRVYVSDSTRNGPAVYSTSNSWSEKRVTWRTRPSTLSGPRDNKGPLTQGQWVEWDVTPWVAGDGTYSFALEQGAPNATGLVSRETAKEPVMVVTTENPPPPPPPTGGPDPIAGLGYHEVFHDDFDTLNRSVWVDHIWYDEAPDPSWSGYQSAESGVLHLRTSRNWYWGSGSSDNWPVNTITTQSSGLTFTQGYFEARMKWTGARGAWPGFWLFSYRHATNDFWPSVNPFCANNGLPKALCYSAELDVFEGQGAEPSVFYGTIHRNSCECYGVSNSQNSNNYQEQAVDLSAGFHTYGMLWTASQITWYLDGQPLTSAPTYDSTNQPMFLLLQMWVGGWTGDPSPSTPDVLETQVDYVDVWQK